MSANGGWETVSNKKVTKVSKDVSKLKKKPSDSMPRIEPAPPVEESTTIYHAFIEEELRRERKLLEKEKDSQSKTPKKQIPMPNKRRDKSLTFEEILESIEIDDLENIWTKDQQSFPKNPNIWLIDLASYINIQLDKIPDKDPVLADKSHDYPVNLMPNKLKKRIIKFFNISDSKILEIFLDHCIKSMIEDFTNGQSTQGYRLFIQILLHHKPEIVLNNLTKYNKLSKVNSTINNLCLFWTVGQAGYSKLSNGLNIWVKMMFSHIHTKFVNTYVINYLETILRLNSELEPGFNVLAKMDYFKFLGDVYPSSQSTPLTPELRKKLSNLYPKIKLLAWSDTTKNLNLFFPGYLSRYTSDCQEPKKQELLDCLMTCLIQDKASFSQWRKDFQRNIKQSSLLLTYINDNFEKLKINQSALRETVSFFHSSNELTFAKPTENMVDYQLFDETCKDLLTKLAKTVFPWKLMFIFFIFLFAGVFAADVKVHGSISDSLSYKILSDYGIIIAINSVLQKTSYYSSQINKWCSDNCPYYIEYILKIISPYLDLLHAKALVAKTFILDNTIQQREYFLEQSFILVEKTNDYLPIILEKMGIILNYILLFLGWIFNQSFYYLSLFQEWLLSNVLVGQFSPGNMQKSSVDFLVAIQSYLNNGYLWLTGLVNQKV